MNTYFTPAALKFLRGLKKHNDRTWFEERRDVFESELKAPMLAVIEQVNHAMMNVAPLHVRPAHRIMMRIYRDTRFSNDKRPYKHHVAAWWAQQGMEKTSGGGYYLHVSPQEVMISAGCYMPEREQLLAIRRWMGDHHDEFRTLQKKILKARKGESAPMTIVNSEALTRMPKGFARDHPADELLRAKTWGVQVLLPADSALQPGFVREIVAGFKRAAPLVEALNEAIETGATRKTPSLNSLF